MKQRLIYTPYRERIRHRNEDLFSNFQLNFDRKFGDHYINAIAGFEASQRKSPNFNIISTPVANNLNLIQFKEIKTFNDNGNDTQARMGYLGRINYSYADKYLVEFMKKFEAENK